MDATIVAMFLTLLVLFAMFAYVTLPTVISLRPFNYRQVTAWHGLLFLLMGLTVLLGAAIDRGAVPNPDLTGIGIIVATILVVTGASGVSLRSLSKFYADRERKLAERQEGRSEHQKDQCG